MSIGALSDTIRNQFETKFFLSRIHESVKTISKVKGYLSGAAMVGAMTVSSVVGSALCWLCMEGSVRSVIDVVEDPRAIVRLRYLGDVGGWTSLTIFTVLAVKSIFERLMAEGEYIKAKELCITEGIGQNPQNYPAVCELFDSLHARCMFSKSVSSRRLLALELFHNVPDNPDTAPELLFDRALNNTYQQIEFELETELSSKKYLKNYCLGLRAAKKRSCCTVTVSRVFAIVFPLWLVSNFALSIIGEVGLGKELFVDREELTDIGHFGEWPINAIEALGSAYLLSFWYAASAGIAEKIKSIYAAKVDGLAGYSAEVRRRLCDIAKQELAQVASHTAYLTLPYDFENTHNNENNV